MSFASFSASRSSVNPFLSWSMGNEGKGRLIAEFPFVLDKGWYAEQGCIEFQTFERRKECGGFRHEFIVLKLLDRSVCRVERMGDPNARLDALNHQRSVAHDMIHSFKPEDIDQAYLTTLDPIAEITPPCAFDLMDVLKICQAIYEGGKTRNYTLNVLKCYSFSLAIQIYLTRLVAHWEDQDLFATWLSQIQQGADALADSFQSPETRAQLHYEPTLAGL
ncbi:hypothetical protein B0J17DRAFT_722139 [Rhizoctonia solani]|nr:hypothetical protein B0J17DRAFT_722139 [Rhizoctonia solani]